MAITVRFPSGAEEDLVRRFTVNRNYLQAIAGFLTHRYGERERLYAGLRSTLDAMPQIHKINRVDLDLADVKRFLTLAWSSEIQLHLPAIMDHSEMLPFANTWAPVHAYYAVYGAMQAWFAANGMTGVADDHTATLRTIASHIEKRDLLPEPWNVLAVGCPMRGDRVYLNDRGADCASDVEVLSTPIPFGEDPMFWPRLGTWLRSTRAARLTAREEQWKKTHRRTRISSKERTRVAAAVAPTSLFDCLWRLRIKSNYGTIDPYLVTYISETDHMLFNRSLSILTRATVSVLELLSTRRIGRPQFATLARDFIAQDGHGLSGRLLRARLDAYGLKS
jgi:hypothetical protein